MKCLFRDLELEVEPRLEQVLVVDRDPVLNSARDIDQGSLESLQNLAQSLDLSSESKVLLDTVED